MNIQDRQSLLSKLNLDNQDICALEDCKSSNASVIMQKCKQVYGGEILDRPNKIKTISYFRYCGCEEDYKLYHGNNYKEDK